MEMFFGAPFHFDEVTENLARQKRKQSEVDPEGFWIPANFIQGKSIAVKTSPLLYSSSLGLTGPRFLLEDGLGDLSSLQF